MTEVTPPARWLPRAKASPFFAGAVLAIVCLYYALSGIEWRAGDQTVVNASPRYHCLAAAISTVMLFLRLFVAQALSFVVIGLWGALGLMRYRLSNRSASAC